MCAFARSSSGNCQAFTKAISSGTAFGLPSSPHGEFPGIHRHRSGWGFRVDKSECARDTSLLDMTFRTLGDTGFRSTHTHTGAKPCLTLSHASAGSGNAPAARTRQARPCQPADYPWDQGPISKTVLSRLTIASGYSGKGKNGFAPSAISVFSDRAVWRSLDRFGSDHLRRRCRWPPLSSISAPVLWSTTFMERRTFPRSSIPRNLTLTSWPSLRTSDGCPKRRLAIWLM